MKGLATAATLASGIIGQSVVALSVKAEDNASLKSAASTAAYGLMKYYTGNNTGDVPGNLPDPYYWWHAGAMFGTLVDYWFYTGDSTYNDETIQAIVHQASDTQDFMPKNQTRTEGNDDQGFWAMTAMSAAENKFPNPPTDQAQYLALAQAVFNQYTQRWDADDCGGGLRWQIFSFNNGYNYKNSISNGCFFNVAARLARYTGNTTYSEWASKIFEWEQKVGLMSDSFDVLDGVTIATDKTCKSIDKAQWTYNAGVHLHGAANMYNMTEDQAWKKRVDGILKTILDRMVKNKVVFEEFCEPRKGCNTDQQTFKGYLMRWLAQTAALVPSTREAIAPVLRGTAQAAGGACSGSPAQGFKGAAGTACGYSWLDGGAFDGLVGVPSQMSAVAALIAPLAETAQGPVTDKTGGTSKGNPQAGSGKQEDPRTQKPITTGDKVAAGFVTLALLLGVIGSTAFMVK
ncbi:Mannan endo-1,6-alpha-mannosidase [Purpureocillium takamizusanense]|uniref:Mannan endo-1,6-alpha-mannosidase n=1 Tax=Purpureocillium takamizusanense TaxID=2060973 RepID=A0A9Q8QGJ6_9HYPO|nr:Mannan endo-1,6-alpha-mannosidase [Purpureocillium takamizusanense]UNI18821.1 Mannan endo-1,6-alpha-mannosidase [Purpureocillium takamizusanense]